MATVTAATAAALAPSRAQPIRGRPGRHLGVVVAICLRHLTG